MFQFKSICFVKFILMLSKLAEILLKSKEFRDFLNIFVSILFEVSTVSYPQMCFGCQMVFFSLSPVNTHFYLDWQTNKQNKTNQWICMPWKKDKKYLFKEMYLFNFLPSEKKSGDHYFIQNIQIWTLKTLYISYLRIAYN